MQMTTMHAYGKIQSGAGTPVNFGFFKEKKQTFSVLIFFIIKVENTQFE